MPPPTDAQGSFAGPQREPGLVDRLKTPVGVGLCLENGPLLFDFLARRHTLTLLIALQTRSPQRFNDLKRSLDASAVTLSERLDMFEDLGLVERQAFSEIPPRVEYSITAKGATLLTFAREMFEWATEVGLVPGEVQPHEASDQVDAFGP